MLKEQVEARLQFLNAAAHLYSSSCPPTAAHLMLQRDIEATSNDRHLPSIQSSASCLVCGTILVPGWTSRLTITNHKASRNIDLHRWRRRQNSGKQRQAKEDKSVTLKCLACHRKTTSLLHNPPGRTTCHLKDQKSGARVATSAIADPVNKTHVQDTIGPEPQKPSTNVSSKRRAKTRKQSGLQAMLEKYRASETPASGSDLGLMDLMKVT